MRKAFGVAICALVLAACSQTPTPTTSHSAGVSPSATQSASPLPNPSPDTAISSYGLLLAAGKVEMVNISGKVAASAPFQPASSLKCADNAPAAMQPSVSASADRVYFRDGDTRIRSLTFDGHTADVTSVPGGASTVSFFSVSPDDTRIAVLVETFTPNYIAERLYVQDLAGSLHHVDIYSTTTPNNSSGRTLWPAGWHQGRLVLAVMPVCAKDLSSLSPIEWHVSDAATGKRLATITRSCTQGNLGILGRWPSAAGIVCTAATYPAIYNLAGEQTAAFNALAPGADVTGGELSPGGNQFFFTRPGLSYEVTVSPWGGVSSTTGREPCLWIDEHHLLAPDSVIPLPLGPSYVPPAAIPTPLAVAGVCAGRYPGGL